jgi:hypothetical protein
MNDTIKKLNERIFRLWMEHEEESLPLPTFLRDIGEGKLLIMGINPSLNQMYKLDDKGGKTREFVDYVMNAKKRGFDIERDLETLFNYEDNIANNHQHGKKIGHFSKLIRAEQKEIWGIDLFYFRDTSQKNFLKQIYDKDKSLTNFAKEQIAITAEAIKYYKPTMIIVANAKASSIVREHFGEYGLPITSKMDEDYGCYYVQLNGGKKVPILFSSPFSGQRALDNGSFERLAWQVRFIRRILKD